MNCKGCMTICTTSKKPSNPKNCAGFIPKTHGNLLRNKTDEELAEFLLNRDLDVVEKASKVAGFTYKVDREQCLANVIDWLKEEVD